MSEVRDSRAAGTAVKRDRRDRETNAECCADARRDRHQVMPWGAIRVEQAAQPNATTATTPDEACGGCCAFKVEFVRLDRPARPQRRGRGMR